ncbi:hypothetical protein IKZ40_09550, partial [bacterium]|nr:hypothetical protein [bacterium]
MLRCAKCGLNGEFEEYTLRHECPECGSEMRLFRIDANISGESLRTRLRELLSAKARGDGISGRIFALLADSPDPEVRKLIDDALYEKYCRVHGIA